MSKVDRREFVKQATSLGAVLLWGSNEVKSVTDQKRIPVS